MIQDFDLHMHTTYCDGRDSAEAMVLSAIEKGLSTVGISGHSFTPFDTSYCMSREGTLQYIDEINMLKRKYAGSIRLLLGIELDRYADTDLSPYDYRIGSVHYLFKGEKWRDVDSDPKDLACFTFGGDGQCEDPDTRRAGMLETAELYFDTVGGIVEATDCDIIGHFDLLTKFNEGWGFGPAGNVVKRADCGASEFVSDMVDTSDERYIAAWKRAVDRIFDDCAERYKNGYRSRLEHLGVLQAGDKPVFEINTGAISKGCRTVPYPAADQIGYIKSKGGVLILSSDSHAAGTVCGSFEDWAHLIQ